MIYKIFSFVYFPYSFEINVVKKMHIYIYIYIYIYIIRCVISLFITSII
jgi:hypothetical protein